MGKKAEKRAPGAFRTPEIFEKVGSVSAPLKCKMPVQAAEEDLFEPVRSKREIRRSLQTLKHGATAYV